MDSDEEAAPRDVWKNKLVFIEFDDRGSISIQSEWSHSCLRTEALLDEICGSNNITSVRLYKQHTNAATQTLVHHAFVVFKTEGRWKYSIEKNRHCITLQRSKCLNDILHSASEGAADTKQQTGKGSIGQVAHYLWQHNCLGLHYHPVTSNSTHFAMRIFSEFSFENSYNRYDDDDSSDDDRYNYGM